MYIDKLSIELRGCHLVFSFLKTARNLYSLFLGNDEIENMLLVLVTFTYSHTATCLFLNAF